MIIVLTIATVLALLLLCIGGFALARSRCLTRWRAVGPSGIAVDWPIVTASIRHHAFARGKRRDAPLLLILPGGPGESLAPRWDAFTGRLAEHFVVVLVETGVGRAGSSPMPPTIADLVASYEQLLRAVRVRLGERPAVLAGHALGAALALQLAQRCPDLVSGVVAISLLVDWREGNDLATRRVRAAAHHAVDAATVAAIATLPPGLVSTGSPPTMDPLAVAVQRTALQRYGMDGRTGRHVPEANLVAYLLSPLHTVREACSMLGGWWPCRWIARPANRGQWRRVMTDVVAFNARTAVPALPVPLLVVAGADDWITPVPLAAAYLNAIRVPARRLVVLAAAGHYPQLDQPVGFQQAVIEFFTR